MGRGDTESAGIAAHSFSMKAAAIGVRMHSGWGAAIAVASGADGLQVIDRRQIVVTEAKTPGTSQPYHFAKNLGLPQGENHLDRCTMASERLALAALRGMVADLKIREYRVTNCAVVMASGRALPSLPEILASHAMIHTAEGEFFRRCVWKAAETLGISVAGIRERDLAERAKTVFSRAATPTLRKIANLGKTLGPPWTANQKSAALAGWIVLHEKKARRAVRSE